MDGGNVARIVENCGLFQLGDWGVVNRGSSSCRCTGSPRAEVDICMELISHTALMQKTF